jgi:endoglucanase
MLRVRLGIPPSRTLRQTAVVAIALTVTGVLSANPPLRAAQQRANPLQGRRMWVNPDAPATKQAAAWARSRAEDAARMRAMGAQPQAIWLGDWNRDPRRDVDAFLSRANGALAVFVVYNIPNRDCGLYSRGGAGDADAYRRWVLELSRGIRNRPSVFIIEPDALAAGDCLPARLRDERFVLVREAVDVLKKAGASVYVDAGHAAWRPAGDMATRLKSGGIELADGFSLNVSNFQSTSSTVAYGNALSRLVGGLHYVIDTGRNGAGVTGQREWCNPSGGALGIYPTADTGVPLADAYLWIKIPGQSDGTCNGGPRAGEWWPEYALGLAKTAETLKSTAAR